MSVKSLKSNEIWRKYLKNKFYVIIYNSEIKNIFYMFKKSMVKMPNI